MKSIKELAKEVDLITANGDLDVAAKKIEEINKRLEQDGKLKRYLGKRLSQHQIDNIIENSKNSDIKQLEIIKNKLKGAI